MAAGSKLAFAAVGFGAAAALSSWNPLAAPFGLVVGLASTALAARALRKGARRAVAIGALILSVGAVAASGVVLALTAGVGREPSGTLVNAPPAGDAAKTLDAAQQRTWAARRRAREELGKVGGNPGTAPTPGATPNPGAPP